MNEDSIMKYQFLQAKFAKLLLFCAAFGVFFSAFVSTTQAQTNTFAQYIQRVAAQDFRFTNNAGTSGTFETVSGGSPIFFVYSNITGLDQSLKGSQEARVFITSVPTTTPATLFNNNLTQPLNQTVVIRILRDTPTPSGVGTGARRNLLTATISRNTATPAITGTDTGNSAAFTVTTPDHTIIYTSDFLNFSTGMEGNRNLGLTFSSVQPLLAVGSGGFLRSFTAAGPGTFASNPPPVAVPVATAASVSISGRVLTPSGRGLRGARVSLIGENGTTQTVLSGNSGYYYFSDVTAGQTAILSVDSKRYSYVPQVLTVTEDLTDANFTTGSGRMSIAGQ